jgi:hypothetical protein
MKYEMEASSGLLGMGGIVPGESCRLACTQFVYSGRERRSPLASWPCDLEGRRLPTITGRAPRARIPKPGMRVGMGCSRIPGGPLLGKTGGG